MSDSYCGAMWIERFSHLFYKFKNFSKFSYTWKTMLEQLYLCNNPERRHASSCVGIPTRHKLPWFKEIRYLEIYFVHSRTFNRFLNQAKKSFYRTVNVIFGKFGRLANEEVVVHLIKSTCLQILLYYENQKLSKFVKLFWI